MQACSFTETHADAGLVWEGINLPRITPGIYQAVCVAWQGPQWVRAFQRWCLRLEFSLLEDGTLVSRFYNLGNNKLRKSHGRRSLFYKVWCLANGEPPCKGQRMPLGTFTEPGLIYTVRVADSIKNEQGEQKPRALVYSRVTDVLRIERR
jgi:hypothetical protein